MSASIINLIVQLIAGAGGSNLLAKIFHKLDLGPLANTIIGALGGLGAGNLAGTLASDTAVTAGAGSGLDIGMLLTQLVAGGVGGPVLTAIVALIRNAMTGARST